MLSLNLVVTLMMVIILLVFTEKQSFPFNEVNLKNDIMMI